MSKEIREQINKFKNFRQKLNENKRNLEEVILNGYVYYVDRDKMVLYDSEDSVNGISVWSTNFRLS